MGVKIIIDDLRKVGICTRAGPWLESHGLDFKDLRPKNGGIDVDDLYLLNDQREQIRRLEEAAIARLAKEGKSDG